jgi:hypothetical protein
MKKDIKTKSLLVVLFLLGTAISSFAANKYWIGTGANSNWNTGTNWSNSSGGATCNCTPNSGDAVIFDVNGNNACTINVNPSIGSLTTTSGYTNTITQSGSLTIAGGGASLSGGTFTGGTANITCGGAFTISGMAFTSTSGTLNVGGNFTLSSGSFTHNSGTTLFASSKTITGSTTFYNLTLGTPAGSTATHTIATGTVLTVSHTLTLSTTNALTINTGEIEAQGDITINNTAAGGGGSALIKINGTGSQTLTGSGTAGTGKLCKVEIDKSSGTLTLASIISIDNDWTYTTGTVSSGTGTPTVATCSSLNLDCQGSGGTMSFYNLTIYGGTTALTGNVGITNNLTINNSTTLSGSSYTMNLSGQWTNNGTFTYGTSTVLLQGTALQTINTSSSTETFYNLTVNKTSGRVLLNDPLIINHAVTFTEGIIKASSFNYFKLVNDATAGAGNDSAFVYGYYKKVGDDAFTFALGDTSVSTGGYHPLSIGAPSSATDAYTALYFNSAQTLGTTRDSILNYTSTCERWNLARDAGSSNVTVKLGWNTTSCNIDSLTDIRVAYWNGSKWKDKGGSYTGNTIIGDVVTSSAQSSFGDFIIAKKYPNANAGNDVTICSGSSTNLVGTTGTSYLWTPGTGLSCTTCYNPTANPTATTNYTYTVTYPSGWQSSDNVTVNVYAPGKVCCSSVSLGHGGCSNDVINYTDSVKWFSFISDSTEAIITLRNTSVVNNYIDQIKVYSGSCGSLTQISTAEEDNIKYISVVLTGLTIGNTYFIKTLNNVSGSDSTHFEICDEPGNYHWVECSYIPFCFEAFSNGHFDRNTPSCLKGNMSNIKDTLTEVACWYNAAGSATPDYYHSCNNATVGVPFNLMGNQLARSDSGYVGFYAHEKGIYQEYIDQELNQTLLQGVQYNCSLYVNLANVSDRAFDKIGMYFSATRKTQNGNSRINVTPQIVSPPHVILKDTVNWMLISGFYTANGSEKHIVIGSFTDKSDTTQYDSVHVVPNKALWNGDDVSYYYVEDVSITGVPTLSNDTTICSGNSVWLMAPSDPRLSHTWSPAATLSCTNCYNPIATPLVTTTYIDSIAYNGCVYVDSVIITVNPTPIVNITDSITDPLQQFLVCQIPQGGMGSSYSNPSAPDAKYYWNFDLALGSLMMGGGIHDTSINIAWTGSTSTYLRLQVVDTITGCSAIDSVLISGCCLSGLTDTNTINIPNGGLASVVFNSQVILAKNIWINGTLVIDQNMTFAGDTLTMGANAKIIMNASTNLTIKDNTTTGAASYIHSCENMWDGIYVTNSTDSIFILNKVIIEDAINGVVVQNDNYYSLLGMNNTTNRIIFNKNLKAVQISNYSNPSIGQINRCIFESYYNIVPGYTYGPGSSHNLRPPYDYTCANTGIEIADVDSVGIGSTVTSEYNTFDYVHIGIKSVNSNTRVDNNRFKDIVRTQYACLSPHCEDGVGVYGSGTGGTYNLLIVGLGRGNIFDNCPIGVQVENNMSLACLNNSFNLNTTGLNGTGVWVNNVKNGAVVVSFNTFTKYKTGIQVRYCDNSYTVIGNNSMANNTSDVANSRGIVMQDGNTSGSSHALIWYNTISNVQLGIQAQNLHGDTIGYSGSVNIQYNTIKFNNGYIPSGKVYGIRLQNCSHLLLQQDTIYRTAASGIADTLKLFGISQEICDNIHLYSNYFQNIGTGMRFKNSNYPSVFKCNIMDHCNTAVLEEGSHIGPQGTAGNASDNQWTNRYTGIGDRDIRMLGNITKPDWYYQGSTPGSSYVPYFQSGSIVPWNNSTASTVCVDYYSGPYKQQLMAPIAKDSIVYPDYEYENKTQAAQNIYRELMMDTTLLNQSTSNDTLLTAYRDSLASTDIGKIYEVNRLIYEGDVDGAISVNNSISETANYDIQHKNVNSIFLETFALGNFSLSDEQRTTLLDIASQHPWDYGKAVYEARAMLDTNFDDEGISSGLRLGKNEIKTEQKKITVSKNKTEFKLYPNPNNGEMVLEYALEKDGYFMLYDFTGRLVANQSISSKANSKRINESNLSSGIYYGIIKTSDGAIVYSNKVLINK